MTIKRGPIAVGFAVALVAIEVLQPSEYISVPLLLLSLSVVLWGVAPTETRDWANRAGTLSPYLIWYLDKLEWLFSRLGKESESALRPQRKNHLRSEFSKLSPNQIAALQSILAEGHGRNVDSNDWAVLIDAGFVESNASGPLGIKRDIEDFVEELFEEYRLDKIGQLLNAGTHLNQENIQTQIQYDDWKQRLDSWVDETSIYLEENFGSAKQQKFLMLKPIFADITGSFNRLHSKERQHLENRLAVLREIIG